MRVVCAYDKIKAAVEDGERIVSRNLTLPILNNLLLEAKKNTLIVSATNLEVGIREELSCKVEKEGSLSVPAKILRGIINNLSSEKIEISNTDKNTLSIKSGKYKGELKGQSAQDFPIIPRLKTKETFSIPTHVLSSALSRVIPFTSVSETRPEITGVLFLKKKNQENLSIVSTDSFRLAEETVFLKKEDKERSFSFIIPQKTSAELLHILKGDEEVVVEIEKNQVSFSVPQKQIISRLIEGTYPDYDNFIPREFKSEVVADKEDLIKTIRLVSLLSSRINDISLRAQKDGVLTIYAQDQDLGENESEIKIDLSGEEIEAHFNWHYLLEGLQRIEGKKVTIKFTSETKAALIRGSGKTDYRYIVMPIRI